MDLQIAPSQFGPAAQICRMYQRENSMVNNAPTTGQVGDALWISDKTLWHDIEMIYHG